MFLGPNVLLTDPETSLRPAPTPHPSQGFVPAPAHVPRRLPTGRALSCPPGARDSPQQEARLLGK